MTPHTLILGAGMAGLSAARTLHHAGIPTLLLDKGRGVGGRVATRKLGDRNAPRGRWDHGAQFATFRSPALLDTLAAWNAHTVLTPWHPGPNGDMRLRSPEGINTFAKSLAAPLTVLNSLRITRISPAPDGGWTASAETGETFSAPTLLCTLPAPQLLDLLHASGLDLPGSTPLHAIRYHRNLTLLAELSGPSGLPEPGYLRPQSGLLHTLTDNTLKGISPTPTVTAQATPAFSLEWYDRDRATAASILRAALQEHLHSPITAVQIHGWKFAEAVERHPAPFLQIAPGLLAAGDGFMAGDTHAPPTLHARIESALLSGIAAAHSLL